LTATSSADATGGAELTMGPALEIVIVSFTGARDLLRAALQSLRDNAYTGGEQLVHVVDNASSDGTAEMVRSEFPEVHLHAMGWNAGFCVANNVVLDEGTAPYLLVLNPDTEAYPGSLDHMVKLMEDHPEVGMAGCRLEKRDGSLDHAAKRSFPTPFSALSHFMGAADRLGGRFARYQAPELDERDCGEVDAINGAWMLVRMSAVEDVGYFDVNYWFTWRTWTGAIGFIRRATRCGMTVVFRSCTSRVRRRRRRGTDACART
jgi:N-acetylglucosaminyl-diphospho-decaprenol L-rhamnosyltransferase